MSQTTAEYNTKAPTFLSGAAFPQYARVKFNGSAKLVVATASDVTQMVANREAFGADEPISVTFLHQAGAVKCIANAAISAEALVYAAADGEVAPTGTIVFGRCVPLPGRPNGGAATADQDIIVVAPIFGGTASNEFAQTVTADDSESALNQITASATQVVVDGVTNDANDFVVLPALADVENGHRVLIIGSAGANFEVRTPATSAEEINSEDCDGTKEYLFTNTQLHEFVKINNTIGWMGHGYSAIGAVVTAVVPD